MLIRSVFCLAVARLARTGFAVSAADICGAAVSPLICARFPDAAVTAQRTSEFDELTLITGLVEREGEVNSRQRIVLGNTDNVRSYDYKTSVSRRRAEAVRMVLIKEFGIGPSRLPDYGVGFLSPTALNSTKKDRAKIGESS